MGGPKADVLRLVAQAAGLIAANLTLTPASGIGSTNRNWIVRDGDARYFLRECRWPFSLPVACQPGRSRRDRHQVARS